MSNTSSEADSLDALQEQTIELIVHARKLQQEFNEPSEVSNKLRVESVQSREDVRVLRRTVLVNAN
jgi:hypothetical protein